MSVVVGVGSQRCTPTNDRDKTTERQRNSPSLVQSVAGKSARIHPPPAHTTNQAQAQGPPCSLSSPSHIHPLQCDRVFPCQSCSKRGCAEICPDGPCTLLTPPHHSFPPQAHLPRERAAGQPTHTPPVPRLSPARFILANTEQLHAKIIQMSDRIRQLEDALGALQIKCATDPHPLLSQDLLRIKNSLELYTPSHPNLREDPVPSSSHLPPSDAPSRPSEVSLAFVSSIPPHVSPL